MKVAGELNDGLHLNLHAPICTESEFCYLFCGHICCICHPQVAYAM